MNAVLTAIESSALVPVYSAADLSTAEAVLRACYRGGIRVFEFTDRAAGSLEVFRGLRVLVDSELPGLHLGVGTITTAARAAEFVEAGAEFLVSPVAAEEAAAWSHGAGVPFIPAGLTPTELLRAQELGAQVVKLFPAASVGPNYLKQLRGPLPQLRCMVTGGVAATPASVQEWLAAGAVAVGLGSDLLPKGPVSPEQAAELERRCRELTEAVAAVATVAEAAAVTEAAPGAASRQGGPA